MTDMTDWGRSGRTDRFEFVECDPFTLAETGTLEADSAASSITWGYYTDNLYSGTVSLAEGSEVSRDRLVRVKHVVEADGKTDRRTLATMFVKAASGSALYGLRRSRADCYSTLYRLTKDVLADDFWRAKGTPVIDAIRAVVEEVGGRLLVLDGTEAGRTLADDAWFELGTNRMEAVNAMAGWMGCQAACDEYGHVTVGPYLAPSEKPVKYAFEAGRNCTYLPGVEEEDNRADIVNRVVAYYTREEKEEGDAFPLTDRAVAELGEESAFCHARCGRYQTAVVKLNDPCSHEELEDRAMTYLLENSGEVRHYTIEHVSIPGLTVGDVVTYENDTDYPEPVSAKCMVVQMDMRSLAPGAKCKTKLKLIL